MPKYSLAQRTAVRNRIKQLAKDMTYEDVAIALQKEGFKRPDGTAITRTFVGNQMAALRTEAKARRQGAKLAKASTYKYETTTPSFEYAAEPTFNQYEAEKAGVNASYTDDDRTSVAKFLFNTSKLTPKVKYELMKELF